MRTATTAIAKATDSQLAEYVSRSGIGCPFAAVTFDARGKLKVLTKSYHSSFQRGLVGVERNQYPERP